MQEARTGTLKYGLKIGDEKHTEFEMREAVTADMFAAEDLAPATKPLQYNGALMTLQLQRIGTFEGPFTLDMIGRLKSTDYAILRMTQMELEKSGEVE